MTTATVIGAGVAGLTVATELMRAGIDPIVVDCAEALGAAQCSWWAGGMLAPWCERESAEDAVVTLGAGAADWWADATDTVQRAGTLVIAPTRDRAEIARFARRTSGFREIGVEEIGVLEPDLAGRFNRALFFPDEAHLDPRAATHALAAGLPAGSLRLGTSEIPPSDLMFDCRGLAASDSLPDLRGVKGEMLVIRTPDITLSRPVRLLHPRHPLYIVPRGDGVFMLGATMVESADRSRITARAMLELLGAAYALHPSFGEAEVLEIGVDARPAFPDNLPRVQRVGDRISVNGLYRHGFLLSPAMARRAVDLALGRAAA